jgi:hypothetical protein
MAGSARSSYRSTNNSARSRRRGHRGGAKTKRRKKTADAIEEEFAREVGRLTTVWERSRASDGVDFEAFELMVRSSMHWFGARLTERLINAEAAAEAGQTVVCREGHRVRSYEMREKDVLSVLGPMRIVRAYYHDARCHRGDCPMDRKLDVEGTGLSPGVRRMTARVGALRPFAVGSEDLRQLAGIEVDAKQIERTAEAIGADVAHFLAREEAPDGIEPEQTLYMEMDGTGVPMIAREVAGRAGKLPDGAAGTREAKLGCVFTQTRLGDDGAPVRDEGSTTYLGAIVTADAFGAMLEREARRRGLELAARAVILGDGAQWIWTVAGDRFPRAIQIVDLYHAKEHIWALARAWFERQPRRMVAWAKAREAELDRGEVRKIIRAFGRLHAATAAQQELLLREMGYFKRNRSRMRYDRFKAMGLFLGSGVIEAGCRTIVSQRLKHSGMHWTVPGADAIIALRCCQQSNRWEDYWEGRRAA